MDGRKLDYVQDSDQDGTLTGARVKWADAGGMRFSLELAKSTYQLLEDAQGGTSLTLALSGADGLPSTHKIVQQAGITGIYGYSYQQFQSAMDNQVDDQDIVDHTADGGTTKGARLAFEDGQEINILKKGVVTGSDIGFLEGGAQPGLYADMSVQFTGVSAFQTVVF